jgi:hypothetical protein
MSSCWTYPFEINFSQHFIWRGSWFFFFFLRFACVDKWRSRSFSLLLFYLNKQGLISKSIWSEQGTVSKVVEIIWWVPQHSLYYSLDFDVVWKFPEWKRGRKDHWRGCQEPIWAGWRLWFCRWSSEIKITSGGLAFFICSSWEPASLGKCLQVLTLGWRVFT